MSGDRQIGFSNAESNGGGSLKTDSQIEAQRILRETQTRVSPLHRLTAERLRRALDMFQAGYLGPAARIWEAAEERDDRILTDAEKRKESASQLGWEIGQRDDSPEADKQKKVLEDFWNNVSTTSAVDEDQRGEVAMLIRQMMDCRAKKYSVHEVIWEPRGDGKLRAEFRHVPLWFFERRSGKLKFLEQEGMTDGIELEDKGWLVTAAPRALMEPCSKAYFIKTLGVGDLTLYSQRAGQGGIHGKTHARKGSAEWDMAVEAVEAAGGDWRVVTNREIDIEHIDLSVKGTLPQPLLIDSMNRAITTLWRGGNLATESSGTQEVGSNPQGDEMDFLLSGDAALITGVINATVDRWVLEWHFGPDVEPLAWFILRPPSNVDVTRDLKAAETANRIGLTLSKSWLRDTFGLPEPRDDDDTLKPMAPGSAGPMQPGLFGAGNQAPEESAEARVQKELQRNGTVRAAEGVITDFRQLAQRLGQIAEMEDDRERESALVRLRAALPDLLSVAEDDGVTRAYAEALAAGLMNGVLDGAEDQKETEK